MGEMGRPMLRAFLLRIARIVTDDDEQHGGPPRQLSTLSLIRDRVKSRKSKAGSGRRRSLVAVRTCRPYGGTAMANEHRPAIPTALEHLVDALSELQTVLGEAGRQVLPVIQARLAEAMAARDRGDPGATLNATGGAGG